MDTRAVPERLVEIESIVGEEAAQSYLKLCMSQKEVDGDMSVQEGADTLVVGLQKLIRRILVRPAEGSHSPCRGTEHPRLNTPRLVHKGSGSVPEPDSNLKSHAGSPAWPPPQHHLSQILHSGPSDGRYSYLKEKAQAGDVIQTHRPGGSHESDRTSEGHLRSDQGDCGAGKACPGSHREARHTASHHALPRGGSRRRDSRPKNG